MLEKLSNSLRRRTSGDYLVRIDGLRFIAIFPVVVHHLAERVYRLMENHGTLGEFDHSLYKLLPSGRLGVEIFFVISGFVIGMPIIKQWVNGDRLKFRYLEYLKRRLTRLEPPYLLVMISGFLLIIALQQYLGTFVAVTKTFQTDIPLNLSLISSLVYSHGLVFGTFPLLNPPAWSLEIEFQFYIVAPLILLLIVNILNERKSNFLFIITIVFFLILSKFLEFAFISDSMRKFLFLNYLEFFLMGFIFSFLYFKNEFDKSLGKSISSIMFLAGLAIAWYGDHFRGPGEGIDSIYDLLRIAGIVLIFYGTFQGGIGSKFTSLKWISIFGGMCYSIYLIHLYLLQLGVFALNSIWLSDKLILNLAVYFILLIPVLVICSIILFRFIEKPCMNPAWPRALLNGIRRIW